MNWDSDARIVELSDRNIAMLIRKLDDPVSARMIGAPGGGVVVRAIEDCDRDDRFVDMAVTEGIVTVTRSELTRLARTSGATVLVADVTVNSVPDAKHYGERPPGPMYMPSADEIL